MESAHELSHKAKLNERYRKLNKEGRLTCIWPGCTATFTDKVAYFYTHINKCPRWELVPEDEFRALFSPYKEKCAAVHLHAASKKVPDGEKKKTGPKPKDTYYCKRCELGFPNARARYSHFRSCGKGGKKGRPLGFKPEKMSVRPQIVYQPLPDPNPSFWAEINAEIKAREDAAKAKAKEDWDMQFSAAERSWKHLFTKFT